MGGNFSHVKAVIFDMDGVLLLSSDIHDRSFRETFSSVGITQFSYANVAGMRTDEVIKKVFAEHGRELPPDELNRLIVDKRQRAQMELENNTPIAYDSAHLIDYLRQKYRLCIASSAVQQRIDLFLRKCGYTNAFEFYVDGESVPNAKPAPDIYLLAAQKLGLKPNECVVIEDATSGIKSAVAAGIPVIAVIGNEEPQEYYNVGATEVVRTLNEIESIL
jgi:beta-phosphoglucomutase